MFKRVLSYISVSVSILLLSSMVMAKDVNYGSGSGEGSSYWGMINDVVSEDWCGYINPVDAKAREMGTFVNMASMNGSVSNMEGMINKKMYGGITQIDVLQFYSKNRPDDVNKKSMAIIAGLHVESFHLMLPNNWTPDNHPKKMRLLNYH